VFVAGQAAIDRHRAAIAWFDSSHLVRVGRPQLDLDVRPALPESTRTTYTYAPTWEGEDDANNYSSVDRYGPQIVEALLAQPDARVVYKPHPRVVGSDDARIRAGHRQILRAIDSASKSDPSAGHAVLMDADMLGVIRSTDILVADVSSVTLDFLYLRPGAPIVLTDRRSNHDALRAESPLAEATYVVDSTNIDDLASELSVVTTGDHQQQARIAMRHYYFDDLAPGGSTERFWTELQRAMDEHDTALRALTRVRVVSEETS